METTLKNRTIALAALFNSIDGVLQIAHKGTVDQQLLETSINSILGDNADNILDVYGGLQNLEAGFKTMLHQLGSGSMTPDGKTKDLEATRYSINILYLEKKLANNPDVFKNLLDGIGNTQKQLEFFDEVTHATVISSLAELYSETISKIGPRIMVKGDQNHLSNPDNAAKIRTFLLAGIRAALLWRQAGGDRWKLLFARGKMQKEAERLLGEIRAS
jgi:high frequency lysogenization protein